MALENSVALLSQSLFGDQIQLVKIEDSERYEIVSIKGLLTFEDGIYAAVLACQLLSHKNDGLILVGVAGPSGAGKSVFTEKILRIKPSVAIIDMDSYIDPTRVIGRDFDDKWLTDYDTLLENIHGLKDGKSVQVPVYDFKSNSRTGYRTLEVPRSRIVILQGKYTLSEKLKPFLDLRVSVTGGVPFNLVKRVLSDIQRAGQDRQQTVHRIFDTVYPTYEAVIAPDLESAHISIYNNLGPYSGFQNPTYILKSTKAVTPEQVKAVLSEGFKERTEETRDIYLLPPGKDPVTCPSYLRLRNRDGKYYLTFQAWSRDSPIVISPGITFEVNVRILGGLIALGYTVAAILKRKSHVFDDDKVTVKIDFFEQLNPTYVQVRGRDRACVENVANQLGLEASSDVPHTYIEQMQLEKLVKKVTALPDDLKAKICLIPGAGSRTQYPRGAPASPATLPDKGVVTQILDQISTLNVTMNEFTYHVQALNSNIPNRRAAASGSLLPSSSFQHGREIPQIKEEVVLLAGTQSKIALQMDKLGKLIQGHVEERSGTEVVDSDSTTQNLGSSSSNVPVLLALAIGCIGILAYSLKKYFNFKAVISPGITFEVNVRILGGLIALGYTVAAILKRKSHVFDDDKVTVKIDFFEQLNPTYVQVRGRDRACVENVANQLGLEASSYVPHTYIEQMQLEKRVNKVTALPDDLKTKISLIPSSQGALSRASADRRAHASPPATLPNKAPKISDPALGVITQLVDQISTVKERMDELTYRLEELNSSIPNRRAAVASGSLLPSSSSQLGREVTQMKEEVALAAGRQRHITLQMDILSKLVEEYVAEMSRTVRVDSDRTGSTAQNLGPSTVPVLLALAIGCIGILAYSLKK